MTDDVIYKIWSWLKPREVIYYSRVYDTLWGWVDENGERLLYYFGGFYQAKGRPGPLRVLE